jgi:hypothetical protein
LSDFDDYLLLVRRLGTGCINRSENDLSSNLKNGLSTFSLHGVIDTGSGKNRTKRPDIALYVERDAADVGAAADVIIESKKPAEISQFATLLEALTHDELWRDKFVPYVAAHAERIAFFILTTFDRFLIVPISTALRSSIQIPDYFPDRTSRLSALNSAIAFDITDAREPALSQHGAPEICHPMILCRLDSRRYLIFAPLILVKHWKVSQATLLIL